MSLLLEALKRAEDRGRRRRAGAAPVPGSVLPQDALAELAPPADPPPAHVLGLAGPDDPMIPVELSSPPDEPAFPALETPSPEPELSLAPVQEAAPAPVDPMPARPASRATNRATVAPSAGPEPATPAAAAIPLAAPATPARATQRPPRASSTARAAPPPPAAASASPQSDARAAERLLKAQAASAGAKAPTASPGRARQAWLLAVVTLLAGGVGLLWFWPQDEAPVRRPPSPGLTQSPPTAHAGAVTAATPAPAAPAAMQAASAALAQAPSPAAGEMQAPTATTPPAAAPPATAAPTVAATTPLVPPAAATPVDRSSRNTTLQRARAAEDERPATATAPPAVRAVRTMRPPVPEPGARSAEVASGQATPSPRQAAAARLQARLQQAFADFQAGRLQEATQAWRDVVTADPTQRDAWLGLAIAAHRQGQREAALAAYQQVLRLEPDNAEAVAGLVALEAAGSDTASESRLREALARNPGQAMLNSALARLLSQQGRWDEAQPFWFAAHTAAPGEASHAYNLAVALDRLRKPSLAAQYYRRALELQPGQAPTFDVAAARARLQALDDRPAPAQP